MNTESEKSKPENQGFSKEAKTIIIAIVTSAVAVIGIVVGIVVALAQMNNANTAELRADMRALRVEMRTDMRALQVEMRTDMRALQMEMRTGLREMQNILLQHVQGHSHLPKTTNPAGANADSTEMTFLHSDSHPSKTTSVAYFAAPWPGKSSDNFVFSSEANASL